MVAGGPRHSPGSMAPPPRLPLSLLPTPIAVCGLPANAPLPAWTAHAKQFLTITRTPEELSITADAAAVPPDVVAQRGYRALRVDGPLPLDLVGIFAALAGPLAAAQIPIFPIATHRTDYLLVSEKDLESALTVLRQAGHTVNLLT